MTPGKFAEYERTFASDNEQVAAVEGATVTGQSVGEAEITGSITYNGAVFGDTLPVSVVDELIYSGLASTRTATGIIVSRKSESIEIGEEYAAQAYVLSAITEEHPWPYGYPDDNLVKWTSSDPEVCRVKNGVLLGISEGEATITAQDIAGTVSASFELTVTAVTALEYTEDEVLTVDESAYDWTTVESTTLALQTILADASAAGKKKIILPNRLYQVSPVYGSIYIPTNMIVDFNGGTVQIMPSDMTTNGGYGMIYFMDAEYSSIENAVIYGERFLIEGTGVEGCTSVDIAGKSKRSGLVNCTISRSPGFNTGCGNTNRKVIGCKLSTIEAGGIDDNGADVDEAYAYRCNTYMNISTLGERFGFGNVQGFGGYMYLSARMYNIYFYDADKNFLTAYKYCVQYSVYDKPEGAVYARVMFWQGSAPTGGDPDYNAIAHLYSFDKPDRCYFRGCLFEDSYSTAIAPNGGENFVIENCTFRNNGYRDPASQIDWEDGRQHNKGHILRNCSFEGGGPVTVIGADGIVIHNNVMNGTPLNVGDEVQNARVWLNQFIGSGAKATITPKTDEVFSQNYGYNGAAYTLNTIDGVEFSVRETENSFE